MSDALLQASGLSIGLRLSGGDSPLVIDDVSLTLNSGESLGIAGESGSGKSTLLLALMGVVRGGLTLLSGSVAFMGRPLLGQRDEDLLDLRGGRLALIPQNAAVALTPTLRIGTQIEEALRLHTDLDAHGRRRRVSELLERVQLPDTAAMARRYPHELSGGQVQRAAIAMALAGDPALLLMDEPTTGLDVTTQLALLDLMIDLRRERDMGIICVSHDLGVLARLCQRVGVMYSGALVEEGPAEALLSHPSHPYTAALLASLPTLARPGLPGAIPGAPPTPQTLPSGCRFAPRCTMAQAECHSQRPPLLPRSEGMRSACFHPLTSKAAADAPMIAPVPGRSDVVLSVASLSVAYGRPKGIARILRRRKSVDVVREVSFDLRRGEVLGLVGESGSGKSTILRAIAGIQPPSAGTITLTTQSGDAVPLASAMTDRPLAQLQRVQMVFQNPDSSLNPRHNVLDLLAQPLRLYGRATTAGLRARATELLATVRLGGAYLARYPSQLSGGERQRVAIARAFAAEPDLLLCDEITTALDVSVQAAVLRLVRDLAHDRQVACIFVSHDLAVVRAIADRIAVLRGGQIVEIGAADNVCRRPVHDYTRTLLDAVLDPEGQTHPGKAASVHVR